MPTFFRVFIPVILVLCLTTACKKEYSYEGGPVKSEDTVSTPEVVNYAPYTKGAVYNYMYNTKTDTFYYSMTVIGDTLIQGNTFFIQSDGYNKQYNRYSEGVYYYFEPAYKSPTSNHPAAIRPVLYDYYPLNGHWSDTVKATTFSGGPETALLDYHIIQKATPKTVMGNTYSKVIGVKQDGYLIIEGKAYSLGTIGNYYYADSVGFVEKDSPTDTIRLISYSLKNQ
jgi:hypothetical protein